MRKFDTQVQELKYRVLREVARITFDDAPQEQLLEIPKTIIPGRVAAWRCCVYKERAILAERVKLALGGNPANPNVIEVIDIACDECPVSGYTVTESCRGCIAHRCVKACRKNAITFDRNQKAVIDKDKCVECGLCAKVCPFHAITQHRRPCEQSCKAEAISMNEERSASISNEKCVACGACVNQCPFGAIMDKSYITNAIHILKQSEGNAAYRTYAVVAPSIASQFAPAKLGQVVAALKDIGFHSVVEAALGADMVAWEESKELVEKGFLTSSCCPAFVSYVQKNFPKAEEHISHNLSPMATIARSIKETDPEAKIIFIGPCTAKKVEARLESVSPYIDCVITFEELIAMFDSRKIDLQALAEDPLVGASFFGRIFARSGGLSEAVVQALKEHGVENFELRATQCDGLEACRAALLKHQRGMDVGNFIEGMACVGGCIGGAGCITHEARDRADVDRYGREAGGKSISDAISGG